MDKIITSLDGSHSVISKKFGVAYHSMHGAIQETQAVFIDAGIKYFHQKKISPIKILEMGMGTGLNVLMTYLYIDKYMGSDYRIDYHTIEAYPISQELALNLNYPRLLDLTERQKAYFYKFHDSQPDEKIIFDNGFSFTKYHQKIENFFSEQRFDIIYYDAFAPNCQEHLWDESMMKKMYGLTAPGGILVTFCAKGSFKRALRSAGYTVEGLAGPIGKREMTRAIK